ncbi:MAG: Alkaline phosphatase synthesis sensor protein PhoR [Firmicutes bacterium ADurb.BinA205]|nr:MAG: Alkaline phosphatase synthesis sensor protein PhoR [Firmicutes bacterium ADurb.BinA205]
MERKIQFSLFYMGIITAITGIVITTFVCYGFFHKEVRENLAHECNIVAQRYDKISSPDELERFTQEDFRITLIKKDGTVLYESDADAENMSNHLDRPEIVQAIENGTGSDTRYSDTIGTEDYYYAVKLDDGNILRVSIRSGSIFRLFERSILIILFVTVCIIGVSMFVSVKLTDKLIAPLKRIPEMLEKNKLPEEMGIYSEIIPLAEEIKTVRSSQELMRQEFTANVSHELKTPLTSISGYAELIETGMAQGEDCKKFAGNIRTETARLQTLISDILRLSELDTVSSSSLDDVVDIAAVTKECKERLTGQAKKKGVRITIHGTSKPVRGNHTELSELIYNLIDNAIKYNRENGNIDITIEDNRFIIADTGIGMPKESIPRIFERFYRVDKSRSRAKGGTGLGLSIVKHIADRHGAQIDVKSSVNVGTTISINFR